MKFFLTCLLSGALSITFLSTPVFAAQHDFTNRLGTCKGVSSLVSRAQCYDTVMDEYDLTTLEKRGNAGSNGWKIETKKSKMTDDINVTLDVTASDVFTTKENTQIRRSLVVSCTEGRPNAYISWNTQISKPEINIRDNVVNSRLGADPIVAERWLISMDKTASFIPKPAEFIEKLLNGKGLYVVTIWPTAYYETIQATFDVQGLADKIKPLKESCHLP